MKTPEIISINTFKNSPGKTPVISNQETLINSPDETPVNSNQETLMNSHEETYTDIQGEKSSIDIMMLLLGSFILFICNVLILCLFMIKTLDNDNSERYTDDPQASHIDNKTI